MNKPKVSLIIPTYNAADYIEDTVLSALEQDYSNLEIIIIDDGSTDSTEQILLPYKNRIVYKKKTNGGLGSARNLGHTIAKGEYIAWLDSDDIATPNRISSQVTSMLNNSDLVLVSSNFSAFGENTASIPDYITQYYSSIDVAGGLSALYGKPKTTTVSGDESACFYHNNIHSEIIFGNFVHPPTILFKRSSAKQVGPLIEDIKSSVDWEFLARLAKTGNFGFIDYPLLHYRLSDNQISSTKTNPIKVTTNIIRVYKEITRQNPDLINSNWQRHQRVLSSMQIDAANALCESKKWQSFLLLAKSISLNDIKILHLKVALKILAPAFLLNSIRHCRLTHIAL